MSSITTIAMPHRYAAFGGNASVPVVNTTPANTSSSASPVAEAATATRHFIEGPQSDLKPGKQALIGGSP